MWNPYQFAGTPFAADPESGWAYVPAMLFFWILPLSQAAASFMLFHVLLAALAVFVGLFQRCNRPAPVDVDKVKSAWESNRNDKPVVGEAGP